ncbi:M20 family metallo-hydrolase [Spelaeicoccus albus]|uniref:N-carbamoyl-L-amino-acid hydrolase n=1 Tax=Spelaeicoccus albus TaxID=1280376 RepID=A0A7Z0CZY7_9MICO|nr:M20 family metallo-hydrolase [Spelaeicoccus albus]NYI66821.1 N-carbamoyl-L-amino-acid hydrolase [Spelaeicoccus albus]
MTSNADVDQALIDDFHTLSRFGATAGGGVDRQAGTAADGEQRRWLTNWLTGRGFTVEFDRVGNQFGMLELVPGAPYVIVGSHLDSQPFGGKYDGAYGVLAAAHAVGRLAEKWRSAGHAPLYNLAVVNWFNEEGCRFEPSMMGSSVYTGKLDLDAALNTRDLAGTTVRDALESIDCLGSGVGPTAAFYAEIHIEQGRVLEDTQTTIGLVEATWAARKYHLVVHGEQSHTGSTVMADRKDAILGASYLAVAAREIADRFTDPALHSSVGQMVIEPNSPVVVAREVRMHLDLRSSDEGVLAEANEMLLKRIPEIERLANVRIEQATAHGWGLLAYHPDGVKIAQTASEGLGLSHRPMMTIAGHDSTNMKDIVPTVMLFVPSVEGISHNEGEFTEDSDISAGVDLLTEVVSRLAHGDVSEGLPDGLSTPHITVD